MNVQQQNLYDADFNAWALDEAKKLKLRKFDALDIDHLVEEIEDMSKREISSLESRLVVLIMHLIKWQVQTQKQCGSWKGTISSQRLKIKKLLKKMPSLKNHLNDLIKDADVYQDALQKASEETGIHKRLFPQDLPYSQEQILNNEFYPDE